MCCYISLIIVILVYIGKPFVQFLVSQDLSSNLVDYITYSIAFVDESTETLQVTYDNQYSTYMVLYSIGTKIYSTVFTKSWTFW